MIYLYNETRLTRMAFVEEAYGDRSGISLRIESDAHPDTPYMISLVKSTSKVIIDALHNRYSGHGVKIEDTFVRDYLMVREHRILMNPETDELVDLGNAADRNKEDKNLYVKNMVVLVLNKDSKYFIKKKNTSKKPVVTTLTDDGEVKVVVMYIKTNNWSHIPANDPLNILIQSGYSAASNVEFKMTSVSSTNTVDGNVTTRHHNTVEITPYTGEFPTIDPNKNAKAPADKSSDVKREYNTKSQEISPVYNSSYVKKDTYHQKKESYSSYNNFKDYDDDDHRTSKKYNGHPKKKKQSGKNRRFNDGY